MIQIKNKAALAKMVVAGFLLEEVMNIVATSVVEGVSTFALDCIIVSELKNRNLISCTKGYMGYRYSSCISINDEVVHGVPHINKIVMSGDLVKVDICASWKGYCADMARCFIVGTVHSSLKLLVQTAYVALDMGIKQAIVGNKISDISVAVQSVIEVNGFSVIRDFAGHGIGKRMHEAPEILNYKVSGFSPVIRIGMAFAIEPMLVVGRHEVCISNDDGWTVNTVDKSMAAHVEDTVIITDNGPQIVTRSNVFDYEINR